MPAAVPPAHARHCLTRERPAASASVLCRPYQRLALRNCPPVQRLGHDLRLYTRMLAICGSYAYVAPLTNGERKTVKFVGWVRATSFAPDMPIASVRNAALVSAITIGLAALR